MRNNVFECWRQPQKQSLACFKQNQIKSLISETEKCLERKHFFRDSANQLKNEKLC